MSGSASGCANNGTCYYQPLPGVPDPGLPICGCLFQFAGPTCRLDAPPKPICDPNDPTAAPPTCLYCNPITNQGCFNGGICYYQPIAGAPPPGVPLCGCHYGDAPPSCLNRAAPLRFCNPANATDFPPACQFCDPFQPTGSNGCLNYGFCSLQTFNESYPPNYELPICATCQGIFIPPQCAATVFAVLPGTPGNANDLRYIWVAIYVVIFVLALLVIAQHVYFGYFYKFILSNITKMTGAILCACASLCGLIYQATNPYGAIYGFPTASDVIQSNLATNFVLAFICTAIAMTTGNWIWIAYNATVPMSQSKDGWPWMSKALVAIVTVTIFACAIGFSSAAPTFPIGFKLIYLFSSLVIAMCLFQVISGTLIIMTIRDIESSDPKLLKRTSVQLVLLSSLELIVAVLLIVLISLPASIYTDFGIYFGLTQVLINVVLFSLLVALLVGFRIAVWQLKEVALPRPNTVGSATSQVTGAKRYGDSKAEEMSKGTSAHSLTGEASEPAQQNGDSSPTRDYERVPKEEQDQVVML